LNIVLDTNIFISGIVFGGYSREIIVAVLEGKLRLFISQNILNELSDVLQRKKFAFPITVVRQIVNEIESISQLVIPKKSHRIVARDPVDNLIIDCAVEAKADFIITGDQDLLVLKKVNDIPIVNPRTFIENHFR
jgi:putative PIN family toxin of toxin-antitoxin system